MSITLSLDSAERDRTLQRDPLNYVLLPKQVEGWSKAPKDIKAVHSDMKKNPVDYASTINLTGVYIPYPKPELFGDLVYATSIDAASNLVFANGTGTIGNNTVIWTSSSVGAPYGVPVDIPLYVINFAVNQFQISTSLGGPPIGLTAATMINLRFVIYTPEVQAAYEQSKIVLATPILYLILRCDQYKDNNNVRSINNGHSQVTHILQRGGMTPDDYGSPGFLEWHCRSEQTERWALDLPLKVGFQTRSGDDVTFFTETDASLMKPLDPYRQSIITFIVTPFIRDATYANHFLEPQVD